MVRALGLEGESLGCSSCRFRLLELRVLGVMVRALGSGCCETNLQLSSLGLEASSK